MTLIRPYLDEDTISRALHNAYMSTGRHHAGIIVSEQLQVGVIIRRLPSC